MDSVWTQPLVLRAIPPTIAPPSFSISERGRDRTAHRVPSSSQSGRRGRRTAALAALVFSAGAHAGHDAAAHIPVGDAEQSIGDDAEQDPAGGVERSATAEIQPMERHHSAAAYNVSGISAALPVRKRRAAERAWQSALARFNRRHFLPQSDVQQPTAVPLQPGRVILTRLSDREL